MNVSCPFQSHICLEGPTAAFRVKSDWIDTNNDLGINSKVSDRLHYRQVTTCSVLHTAGYIFYNSTDVSSTDYYNYGPTADGSTNFTFSYNLEEQVTLSGYIIRSVISYDISDIC